MQLTAITNPLTKSQCAFHPPCRQTRMFTFSGERDDHFLLTMYTAELKSWSHRTDFAGTHDNYFAILS